MEICRHCLHVDLSQCGDVSDQLFASFWKPFFTKVSRGESGLVFVCRDCPFEPSKDAVNIHGLLQDDSCWCRHTVQDGGRERVEGVAEGRGKRKEKGFRASGKGDALRRRYSRLRLPRLLSKPSASERKGSLIPKSEAVSEEEKRRGKETQTEASEASEEM